MKAISYMVILLAVFVLFLTTPGLPALFDPGSPASLHVSPRYITHSLEETGSENFVTAVLADYRSYDTLGETTVIFTAGAATVLLLWAKREKSEEADEGDTK